MGELGRSWLRGGGVVTGSQAPLPLWLCIVLGHLRGTRCCGGMWVDWGRVEYGDASPASPVRLLLYLCFSLYSVARAGTGAVVAVKEMPTLALPLVRKYQYALLASVAKLLQPPASPSPAKLEATGTVLAACDLMARVLVAATAALSQASTVERGVGFHLLDVGVAGFLSLDVGV
jgi:hypothetical protein